MTPCPPKDLLLRLLTQALAPAEMAPVERHIQCCASCQQTLDRLTSVSLWRSTPTLDTATQNIGVDGVGPSDAQAPEGGLLNLLPVRQSLAAPSADGVAAETDAQAGPSRPDGPCLGEEIPGFEILARIGRGAMGVVYKARHRRLDRIVALKMIRSGSQASAAEMARFRTEAQAAARLQHPSIVQVHEVGEADGQPFLCMEYVEGESLDRRINGTPWPVLQGARLVETLARAIDAAHQQGIVHRDLKPANILLVSDGVVSGESSSSTTHHAPHATHQPKITDFGLAKMLGSDQGQTESGLFVGTPSYAAPEQAGAEKFAIGPATDIYALGAILYELLTGRPPFRGATLLETIHQILEQEPVPPRLLNPAVPADLEAICLKCLEKNRARRYGSAAALAEDLHRWQHHEPILARPPGPLGRAGRWCRRHPALSTIAAVVLLALLGISWQWREAVNASALADQRRQEAEHASVLARKAEEQAQQARQDAVEEAAAARDVANFLGGLFEQADPFVLTGRILGEQPNTQPTALDIVDRGATRLARPDLLKEKPLVRAGLLDKVGHVYLSLGEGAKASPLILESLELRRQHLHADHADLASSLHNVGFMHLTRGNFQTSEELFADALAMRTRLFGARSPEAMTSQFHLALVQTFLRGRSPERLLLEVLEFQRGQVRAAQEQGPGQVSRVALECTCTLLTLGNYYAANNQHLKGLPYVVEATGVAQKIANQELVDLAGHLISFRRWQAQGRAELALQSLQQALATLEKRVGRQHYLYVALQRDLAYLFLHNRRNEEAEKAFIDMEGNYRRTIGGDGQRLAELSYHIAQSIRHGRLAQAESAGDLAGRKEQAARVERYARAAYREGEQSGLEESILDDMALFLAEFFLKIRPEPDNAAAEEFARAAVRRRTQREGVWRDPTHYARQYLLTALLRQGKVDAIEEHLSDALARDPHLRFGANGTDTIFDSVRALARAGKTRTALLLLEQVTAALGLDQVDVCSDPAFDSLRELEAYRQLLAKLPAEDPDPNRNAVNWVLRLGGRLHLQGVEREIRTVDELPKGQIVLSRVWLEGKLVTDAGLARFKDLAGLTDLFLKSTQVTDAGLVHLRGCQALTHLSLGYTKVRGAGLVHLKECKALIHLGVDGTSVSDAGLVHLKDCKGLCELWLCNLALTDGGLVHLKGLERLRYINLENTQVTNAGLAHLQECKALEELNVGGTKVTEKGLAGFHVAVPRCKIHHDRYGIEAKK